eukprot:654062-Rhodomonas_salina.4
MERYGVAGLVQQYAGTRVLRRSVLTSRYGGAESGPTEVERHNQADMGLTDADILDLTRVSALYPWPHAAPSVVWHG